MGDRKKWKNSLGRQKLGKTRMGEKRKN